MEYITPLSWKQDSRPRKKYERIDTAIKPTQKDMDISKVPEFMARSQDLASFFIYPRIIWISF
jgi:hypothetical protein